jgi:predicted secreted protein with PEFG-CTERM motif
MTADTEAETEFELNYSHSAHTVEIVGTNAVPEFGQITAMILAASLISLIAVFRTKFWQNLR